MTSRCSDFLWLQIFIFLEYGSQSERMFDPQPTLGLVQETAGASALRLLHPQVPNFHLWSQPLRQHTPSSAAVVTRALLFAAGTTAAAIVTPRVVSATKGEIIPLEGQQVFQPQDHASFIHQSMQCFLPPSEKEYK